MPTDNNEKKILVVDDDPSVRGMLREFLELYHYTVAEAHDGEEGLEVFVRESPQLVISDIYMPRMNGLHLLRNIRRKNEHVKVILITGYNHYRQLADDAGSRPNGYFEKPFNLGKMLLLIEKLIGKNDPAVSES